MYIDNIRISIKGLTDDRFEEYLKILRNILRHTYGKSVKPSELRNRVIDFTGGKDPSIEYFEAYLLAFDKMMVNGAIDALRKKELKHPSTWGELLIKITEDHIIPSELLSFMDNKEKLLELQVLFFNAINYCKSENPDTFFRNVQNFNEFFHINSR